jgi:hypothetical protein
VREGVVRDNRDRLVRIRMDKRDMGGSLHLGISLVLWWSGRRVMGVEVGAEKLDELKNCYGLSCGMKGYTEFLRSFSLLCLIFHTARVKFINFFFFF